MAEPSRSIDGIAGLVEAATAAADQENDWAQRDATVGSAQPASQDDEGHGSPESSHILLYSGQYDPNLRGLPNGNGSEVSNRPGARKRKREIESAVVGNSSADEQAADPPVSQQSSFSLTPAAARPAAALFRAPSTTSKKYTRPPMSKLFSSLQLLPEDFLHLQSAAKAYMLDSEHPERRDCVGQRGKTDSDMVKLKLWNCVQEFLDREGNGERFFGTGARKVDNVDGQCGTTWPNDVQQIVKICVPLLRRMVTNERQRQYAVESRKGGGESKQEVQGQNANQSEQQVPRAMIDEMDIPATFTAQKIDIFGDGVIPDSDEASEWYGIYNNDAALDKIFIKSGFPRVLFLPMITNIDGHCRLYHGDQGPLCSDSCKTRFVDRLLDLPIYQQNALARDPLETVRAVFHVILTHLIITCYWKHRTLVNTANSEGGHGMLARTKSNSYRLHLGKKSIQKNPEGTAAGKGRINDSSLQLLIHIVQQDNCILPPFDIQSNDCPSLEALRKQIQEHYSLAMLQEKGVTSLSEATLKVWLPDGLVRVEDDGQWMVALLSADKVEWMGGEIRVLLEI